MNAKTPLVIKPRHVQKCGAPVDLPSVIENNQQPKDIGNPVNIDSSDYKEPISEKSDKYTEYFVHAVIATIALFMFRNFWMEDFYVLLGEILAKIKLSSLEYNLGLYAYDIDSLMSDPLMGYIVPWIVFYKFIKFSILTTILHFIIQAIYYFVS